MEKDSNEDSQMSEPRESPEPPNPKMVDWANRNEQKHTPFQAIPVFNIADYSQGIDLTEGRYDERTVSPVKNLPLSRREDNSRAIPSLASLHRIYPGTTPEDPVA